jgi:hypothetical protein
MKKGMKKPQFTLSKETSFPNKGTIERKKEKSSYCIYKNKKKDQISLNKSSISVEKKPVTIEINGNPLKVVQTRPDVLFKNFLRAMKKAYLNQFNEATLFIKKKRYRGTEFFLESLAIFIEEISKNEENCF